MAQSAVTGRMTDDYTMPIVLGTAVMAGAVLALVGLGLGIAVLVLRRRRGRAVPVAPQPVQPVQ
ncbi:hypothetical protein [Streptomyces turgidiscabies]|uniref:Uncharacterized protein n=1 Tax=Streptomyces turgidiscabies TaxID=85558 RepID=A0ABU0RHL6_9ACTN|nr:hypothetical protein [Streptomyces turgidiscabies]MDQ0931454.1 hypothetical protein [Streptomyces turgidiscabies]